MLKESTKGLLDRLQQRVAKVFVGSRQNHQHLLASVEPVGKRQSEWPACPLVEHLSASGESRSMVCTLPSGLVRCVYQR